MPRKSAPARPSGHAVPRPTVDEILNSGQKLNRVTADFLKIDLETALTFTGIALKSSDGKRRERNRAAARKAYDTIKRLAGKTPLTEQDAEIISTNLERLKSELTKLGEFSGLR